VKKSENVGELVEALAKAQAEFTPALKDSKNPYYNSKYADLASVIGAVRPALNKNGLILTQDISADLERQVAIVKTSLYHGDQFFEIEIEAPAKGQSKKDEQSGTPGIKFDVQTIGAATLYLRRYSVAAICGLAAEDDEEDDGNSLDNENKPIQKRTLCPNCGKDAVIKGKPEYGGGWLCYSKKGGCGAKFTDEEWESISTPQSIQMQDSHLNPPSGAPTTPQPTQPDKQQTASQTQAIQGPTKRIPATPPDELDGLIATVASIKEWPKTNKFNATMNVKFATPLEGANQGVAWKVDFAVCWHSHLMESLRNSVGKECHFLIKENDRKKNVTDEWPTHYVNIEDVVSITDPTTGEYQEYVEGKPVIAQQ
jgi:hypothetical protein